MNHADSFARSSAHLRNSEGLPMTEDPIVAEIRRHRKALAEQYGNDVRRIVEALASESETPVARC